MPVSFEERLRRNLSVHATPLPLSAPAEPRSLGWCIRYLAGMCDGAHTEDGIGFNKFDAERGHKLARTPEAQWSPWDRKWAWERVHFYRKQLARVEVDPDSYPEPTLPERQLPVKRVGLRGTDEFTILYAHLPKGEFDDVKAGVSAIPGRQFIFKPEATVVVPRDAVSIPALLKFVQRFGFEVEPGVADVCHEIMLRGEELVPLSRAVQPPSWFRHDQSDLPSDLRLWPHQEAGLAYLKRCNWRVLVADQMGTGKSAMSLRAAKEANAFPLLILCPKPTKESPWVRSALRWLPGKVVNVLHGGGAQSVRGDVVIANYDILRWGENDDQGRSPTTDAFRMVSERKWAGIICDETHNLKSPEAMRTRAVARLLATQPVPFRLFMTGSPVLNRVDEFTPQLDMLGLLAHFGGRWRFEASYRRGNLKELNQKLREIGYLCRLKDPHVFTPDGRFVRLDEVPQQIAPPWLRDRPDAEIEAHLSQWGYLFVPGALNLPEKLRDVIPLPLANEQEYKKAHNEFSAWLWEQLQDPDRWSRAMRAEALVKIEKLKQLSVKGKLKGAIGWIDEFLMTGEKLVVYTWHDEPLQFLVNEWPGAACIRGGQSETQRTANVDRFASDSECKLLVANIKSGGVGIDSLQTACSTCAFIEFGWNPDTHNQAEDRLHRGGQVRDVMCWYMPGTIEGFPTIDEYVLALIDQKRPVVAAAAHGGDVESGAMLSDLLQRMMEAAA